MNFTISSSDRSCFPSAADVTVSVREIRSNGEQKIFFTGNTTQLDRNLQLNPADSFTDTVYLLVSAQ